VTVPKEKPAPPLAIGGVVADKYRIDSLLGEGGMGFVFEAQHLQLGHRVALKVLHSSGMADREVTERFLREGRALARLQGEHIARVSDVGTLPTGEPYLVMEFLEGRDLARELAARGPLPLAETVDLLAQACEALAEAHVRGIVHRDLKPANLFLAHKLDGEPCVKVLDFGISKVASADDAPEENITITSTLVGTPKYMSPEQIQDSRSVDLRTDIWGLGTILYELLTQQRPFAAPTLALVCVKVLHDEVPAPSTLRSDLPPGLDAVVARCLKKDPAERWANVRELVEALAPFGPPSVRASAGRIQRILAARGSARFGADSSGSLPGVPATPVSAPRLVDSGPGATATPSSIRVDKETATLTAATFHEATIKKPSRRAWIAGAAGAAFVVGGVIVVALHSSSKPEQSSAAASARVALPEPTETKSVAPPAPSEAPSATVATAPTAPSASATATAHPHHAAHHVTTTTTSTSQGGDNVLEDRR